MALTATKISTMPCDTAASDSTIAAETRYLPRAQAGGEQPEAEHGQRERDRERVLARHRRLHVAAVDLEALVEQEAQPADGEQFGNRMAEGGEPSERPAGEREQHEPGDRDQLERDAVREHHVEGHDGERRDHHVEAVERQAAVPVHGPAGQLEVRQQVVAEVRRRPHVGAHVATGRRRVVEHEVAARRERVQVDDHHHDDRRGDEDRRGHEHADDAFVRPRSAPPGDRPPDDPPPRRRYQGGPRARDASSSTASGHLAR